MHYAAEIAALATAFCWSTTSMFFAAAGKRIGAFQVNQIRIVMAVGFLVVSHLVLNGEAWPDSIHSLDKKCARAARSAPRTACLASPEIRCLQALRTVHPAGRCP